MGGAGGRGIGIFWMLAATAVWSGTDALAKHLGHAYPQTQIAWVRFLVQMVILTVWFAPRLRVVIVSRRLGEQLFRSAMMVVSSLFIFFSLARVSLVFMSTMSALTPVLVTLLAAFALRERVGARRWAGVAGGLAGALVVIGPGGFALTAAVVLPLIAVSSGAIYQTMTRRLAGIDPMETTLFYTASVGAAAGFVAMPFIATGVLPLETVWAAPDLIGWVGLIGMGVGAMIGHIFMTMAYAVAPASVIAPFIYAGIIWSAGLGMVLFGEYPPATTLVGAAIIVSAGLAVLMGEGRRPVPAAEKDEVSANSRA